MFKWAIALAALSASAISVATPKMEVHRYTAPEAALSVNGYVVETSEHVVVIDATLTVSSARAFKDYIDSFGKPVAAFLVTHAHPDHYNGLQIISSDSTAPIYATKEVRDAIAAIDLPKDRQWRPVFGEEWPTKRRFPTASAQRAHPIVVDNVDFRVEPIGPAESNADSVWIAQAGAAKVAFVGDELFNGTHSYMCDGHTLRWLAQLDRLEAVAQRERWRTLYTGHGDPISAGDAQRAFERQRSYIRTFRRLAGSYPAKPLSTDDKGTLTQQLGKSEGVKGLEFMVGACADSVATEARAGK